MLNALIATILVFVSVGVVFYLAGLLLNAASLPLGRVMERWHFARYAGRARRCDELMQRGDTDEALRQLRSAFYLRIVANRALAGTISNHHTALLSRLIAATSDVQGGTVRLLSLAKTDRLLTERSDLQKRYFAARQGAPRERVRELQRKLEENGNELATALEKLIAEVRAARQTERYH